jgi:uncharacterized membrane protein YciS (DUF1049 family)
MELFVKSFVISVVVHGVIILHCRLNEAKIYKNMKLRLKQVACSRPRFCSAFSVWTRTLLN